MPNTAIPSQATVDYQADPPSGPPPERVRVALIAGSGSQQSDDLYRLLRRRLLIATTIGTLFWCLGAVHGLWLLWRVIEADQFEQHIGYRRLLIGYGKLGVCLVVVAGAAYRLWRRPPKSIIGLRAIEIVSVGVLAAVQLSETVSDDSYGLLTRLTVEPGEIRQGLFARYALYETLGWFTLIVVYGTLIPNTLRRCLAVTGGMALAPTILFSVYAFWLQPIPRRAAVDFLILNAQSLGVAVAVAAFSSSRVERYRRQAAEARKLGQYVLRERLGTGGMGEVYRAEHVLLRRPCALKIIRPDKAGDPKNLLRFEREVQATATLTHPNTVQIYDYGHAEDGTFYYVMEYLPGVTLDDLVRREGPLPPARAVHFLRQVCAALREAHGRGLIHRDIKPGNVMVCERGGVPDVAKLLDFGLVLPLAGDRDDEKLTQVGSVTGTPAYLSPEQAGGQENLDARSDIYSVGALAYFLLTGQPPFAGRSGVKMLAAHLYEVPQPLSAHRPDVPADLSAVVQRCLAKDPNARFPDVGGLDTALAACRSASRERDVT